jgi:hypothetical protein
LTIGFLLAINVLVAIPALLNAISIRPCFDRTSVASLLTSSDRVKSVRTKSASNSLAAFSPASALMSTITILAPFSLKGFGGL